MALIHLPGIGAEALELIDDGWKQTRLAERRCTVDVDFESTSHVESVSGAFQMVDRTGTKVR